MNEKIYKGSSKTLYQSDEDYALIMSFDDTLKIPGQDSIEVAGKGVVNNSISSYIMQKLEMVGIDNHLISKTNMRQQLVQFVDVYPIQIHICTIACGRYVTDFGMEDGFEISNFFYGRSFITDYTGEVVAEGSRDKEEILISTIDLDKAEDFRSSWGIFRDRRTDLYKTLLDLDGTE